MDEADYNDPDGKTFRVSPSDQTSFAKDDKDRISRARAIAVREIPSVAEDSRIEGSVLIARVHYPSRFLQWLPEDTVADLIRLFFNRACDPILEQSGWIVRFLAGGQSSARFSLDDHEEWTTQFQDNGLVALFYSRSGQTGAVERALKAGVLMVLAAHRFRPWLRGRYPKMKLPEFTLGVGVSVGSVLVHHLGQENELAITGQAVYTASQLSDKTGDWEWSVAVTQEAVQAGGSRFLLGHEKIMRSTEHTSETRVCEITGMTARPGADTQFYELLGAALSANAAGIERSFLSSKTITFAQMRTQQQMLQKTSKRRKTETSLEVEGYRLLRKLGEGGMSQVFLALHLATGQERVLKMLPTHAEVASDLLERFIQEFSLVSQIDHPNVAHIFEQGFNEDYVYISLEYFSKGDLRVLLQNPLKEQAKVAILLQIASGLTAVHTLGIVHRDLKPDNIMIRANGSIALADFGIAKQVNAEHNLTRKGEVYGTPYYLSPEQAQGLTVDLRADIYSLGVLFYEMLTGVPPFHAETAHALMYQHVHMEAPPLPTSLSRYQPLIRYMIAKKPDQRFKDAPSLIEYVVSAGLMGEPV